MSVLITGGNRGIGLEFVKLYVATGVQTIVTTRGAYEECEEVN